MTGLTLTKIATQGSYVVSKAEGYEAKIIQNTLQDWQEKGGLFAMLDLNDVDIICGEGHMPTSLKTLKELVHHSKKRRESGKPILKIVNPGTYLKNLLELSGTKEHFDPYPTLESALEADKQSRA